MSILLSFVHNSNGFLISYMYRRFLSNSLNQPTHLARYRYSTQTLSLPPIFIHDPSNSSPSQLSSTPPSTSTPPTIPPFQRGVPMFNSVSPHHPQSTFNDPWDGSHAQLEWSTAIRQVAEQGLALPISGASSSYDAKEVEEDIHTANQRRNVITAEALSAFGIVPVEAVLTNPPD